MLFGYFQPGDSFAFEVPLTDDTGALANADALPTLQLSRNGVVDGAAVVSVANQSTGWYLVSGTFPVGWANGDIAAARLLFAMGGISTGAVLFRVRLTPDPYSGTPPTPPTVEQIRTEMEEAGGHLALAKALADKFAGESADDIHTAFSRMGNGGVADDGTNATLYDKNNVAIKTYP